MSERSPKKTRTWYMHTLDGAPATYVEGYGGPFVGMVVGRRVGSLVASLATIRRQQARAIATAEGEKSPYALPRRYGYIRVKVPRV